MAKTANYSIRLDPNVKHEAEEILAQFGITTADAVNMLLHKIIMVGGLPFDLSQPRYNAETEAAMAEARQLSKDAQSGKIKTYSSAAEVMKAVFGE